tara:strand:- start:130 stop:558 length:429 start_codon:yes stop_codon:yes gene_type:complete
MKRTYITENNIFDLIKIGKRIELYYDDVNEGMYNFMPKRFVFTNPFVSFVDVIDQRNSGCNGSDYEIIKSNSEKQLYNFKIEDDKIIFDIMQGIGVQGHDLNMDPLLGERFFMTDTWNRSPQSKDIINHLCRGSGSERLFII